MIKYNPNRKTLEQDEYIYELQDVAEPKLLSAIGTLWTNERFS